ncbi:hypothetical protein ACLB2K_046873 [Fragaria x ananassa]
MAGGAGGGALNTQALSLLAAVNNHGDLAVKLSSLKQAKDLLLSIDSSSAADLFPYLVELQSSPETLVRLSLIQVIEEIGLRAMEESSVLMSVLLAFLRDSDSVVARQSIVSGTNVFVGVLEELMLQFHRRGKIEIWLEELWSWMVKFKDAVFTIAVQPGSAGTKLLMLKFLETYVLLFTSDTDDSEKPIAEGCRRGFNISWLVGRHPILDSYMLMSEANRALGILLNLLQSAGSLRGSLTIAIVNCLAAVARKRPIHYGTVVSALFDFDPNFEAAKGRHVPSIQYSLRTAFLGFLRCTSPVIVEPETFQSRDRLLRALRSMNAGDAADQVIRQVDKMLKYNERASRDARSGKDDHQSSQLPVSGDLVRKRPSPLDVEESANGHEIPSKRSRYTHEAYSTLPVQKNDSGWDTTSVNGVSSELPMLDGEVTPVEQMITVIGALLAEGERGAESIEILVSTIHPDLLADIVITNMRHLPKMPPPLARPGLPVARQIGSLSSSAQVISESPTSSVQSPVLAAQMSFSSATVNSLSVADTSNVNNLPADSKRDPRRDPRRLDPRSIAVSAELASSPAVEDTTSMQSDIDGSVSLNKLNSHPILTTVESTLVTPNPKTESDGMVLDGQLVSGTDQPTPMDEILDGPVEDDPTLKVNVSSDLTDSRVQTDEDLEAMPLSDVGLADDDYTTSFIESDQRSPALSNTSEEICQDLPDVPIYIELTQEQKQRLGHMAVERIIQSYKHLHGTDYSQMHLALLARLVAQIDVDDEIIVMLHKHIVVDYQQKKGHELVLHILYHLEALALSESVESSTFAVMYEKFLLAVAKCLLESFPASDKLFSRLLGEVPVLPNSTLKLLDDLCYSDVIDQHGKDVRDTERVTQGLGAVWSLILGRPQYRQSCLDITLKCAVHPQDDIRTRGVRLVANKLYQLSYISEVIEKFATDMLLSAVEQPTSGIEHSQSESTGRKTDGTKPSLIQLVFNTYGCAPQAVKQAFDRNIPVLIRALGSSNTDLLHIISDPPKGSENLLMLDVTILIPMLSSLTKNEVLPIFPRLVALPLEKFQTALAHILQITDVCSACFEQRTVFTQQVLAKALNQMVDQTPIPLLFMRTVIQAIDAFPSLVDFVMEILSKLVRKQVWRMPKLWVGFLKCASQTQPHSFHVLLQLPPPQLESALNKYANVKGPLAAYASQASIKASLSRPTLAVLGLANEPHLHQSHLSSPPFHPTDATSSTPT